MLREPKLTFDADQIGIDTLKFIASHEDLMQRFINLTGFEASTLRNEAAIRRSTPRRQGGAKPGQYCRRGRSTDR